MKRVIISFVVLILGCNLDDNSKMERKSSSRLIGESRVNRLDQEKRAFGSMNFGGFSGDSDVVYNFQNYDTLKALENKNKFIDYSKIEFLEGVKSINVFIWPVHIRWIKIKARDLFGERGDFIKELSGIKYSYLLSPVDGGYLSYAMPLIIFETTRESDPLYSISGFKLISKGSDINFNENKGGFFGGLPMSEKSVESGLVTAYPFGSSDAKKVVEAFVSLYNNGTWSDMIAEITIKSKQHPKNEKVYRISLDSQLFNVTMKKIIEKYPNIKSASFAFNSLIN
ncbi:S2/P23 family protein [Borreliella carolinensis]|uniref:S2/P23 family protein n=1 Tax=Borreliella carolinensis TaxID=478174 RepID=A0ABY9E2R0_9SPIR|nr:S2/P23 family protein [Borreliella carolinensis]WKC90357.1 S2/P23 family protein [Borreliella carolinensis]WNY68184.1 S2/P23 family protein [Borreliella carolinensis]